MKQKVIVSDKDLKAYPWLGEIRAERISSGTPDENYLKIEEVTTSSGEIRLKLTGGSGQFREKVTWLAWKKGKRMRVQIERLILASNTAGDFSSGVELTTITYVPIEIVLSDP